MSRFGRVDKLERRDLVLVNVREGNTPVDGSLDRTPYPRSTRSLHDRFVRNYELPN